MKNVFLFIILLLLSIIGMFVYKKYTMDAQVTSIKTPVSHATPYSLDTPPSQSLRGSIVSSSGDVFWESRSATDSSKLLEKVPVLQGEEFWTNPSAILTIQFPQSLEILMQENTHVIFTQTLPTNFVVTQESGEILYKNPKNLPFSVRVLHLLVKKDDGEMTIRFDDNGKIHISSLRGSITVAFNDTDNLSTLVSLKENDVYVFDDPTRTGIVTTL